MAEQIQLVVPDIGGATDVEIIEVPIKVGDSVELEQTLITLEGDKATMEVPAASAGVVKAILVKVGDRVSQGSPIADLEISAAAEPAAVADKAPEKSAPATVSADEPPAAPVKVDTAPTPTAVASAPTSAPAQSTDQGPAYAGPSVRRMARELGVDLTQVTGTGRKQRIVADDVRRYVKSMMEGSGGGATAGGTGSELNLLPWPVVDFAKFGEVEVTPLSKIKRISGANLHRNWVQIPHVTQFDEADVTDLETLRKELKPEAERRGVKLTPLVFMMRAVVATLRDFPQVCASLDPGGEHLIMKKYFHVGVAVDTPNGLVVPVIRDVDQKGFFQLAEELAVFSQKARDGKLSPLDMQGGCFTISSLGGISGTGFTPIVNAPEVAILGVSKMQTRPVFADGDWQPRLMVPLSFSYDHRVVDGADGARFTKALAMYLSDIRRILI